MTSQTCVCDRHTAKTPPYNIRGFEFRAISGLGRIGGGGGLVSDFEHHHHVVHLGLGRASWQGTQGLPPPFRRPLRPSCDAVFAPISAKSGCSRASGLSRMSWERRRPGPASAASRSLQKIVGAFVGAASRTGREHLQGSSPFPFPPSPRPSYPKPCPEVYGSANPRDRGVARRGHKM